MNRTTLRLLACSALVALAPLAGCSPDLRSTVFSELASADKGWAALPNYERGKHYLLVHDYGLAIDPFEADLRDNPNSVNSLNGLAIAYAGVGRPDLAQKYFALAIALDPDSPITLANLAHLSLSRGNNDDAAEFLAKAKASLARPIAETTRQALEHSLNSDERNLHATAEAPGEVTPRMVERLNSREWIVHPASMVTLQPAAPVRADDKNAVGIASDGAVPVEIVNSSGKTGMARQMREYLKYRGFAVGRVRNGSQFGQQRSVLFCQRSGRAHAEAIAAALPMPVRIVWLHTEGHKVELFAARDLDAFQDAVAQGATEFKRIAKQ